jgi:hypothetical protein
VRNGKADGVLFSAEEEAFIEQSVAFLEKRENADLIIEEVWTQSVLDRHDSLDDPSPDETLSPVQVAELGPNGVGSGMTAAHAVTAIQSGRGAKPSESDTGTAGE